MEELGTEQVAPPGRKFLWRFSGSLLRGRTWRSAFAALRYRNYRLYFWGQMTSLFGTWMHMTAQAFLVYELTRSAAFLGLVGFVSGIPSWLFMLYGGAMADRVNRKNMMLLTQSVMTVLAFALAFLTFTGWVRAWEIMILAFLSGVATAFDAPSRHALVAELVENKEDLTNAIALNSMMFNTAAVVGPALAGIVYALVGPAWCFSLNGVSFIAIIVALLAMRFKPRPENDGGNSVWADMKEGIRYVARHPLIGTLIGLVAAFSFFGVSFAILLPAWTVKVLHGDAAMNGVLYAARGVGALGSALAIAVLGRFRFKGKLLTLGTFGFPLFLYLFSVARWPAASIFLLVGVGGSSILVLNLANALIQILVSDGLRGRVMSLYSLAFFGMNPLGALWVGMAAQKFGVVFAIVINATAVMIIAGLIFFWVPSLRAQK